LRRRSGHRGPFSIDGVATLEGFRPTEINPRFSVGYGIQAATLPSLHGGFFVRALVEGDIDVPAQELEEAIVRAADESRAVRLGIPVEGAQEAKSATLSLVDGVIAEDPEGARVDLGPSPSGSFLFWGIGADSIPAGSLVAPIAGQLVDFVRERWGTPIPECTAAVDVHAPT
ncbi:MAG: hypothetical protein R3246_05210, partial [Acidimicrobiia bacterium]|nr:hypothetical protein [Acidimicrobiia bacterium]